MSGDNMTNMHTHMHTHTAAANNTPLRPATLPTPSIDQSPITPEALGIAKTQFTRRKRDKDNEAEKKEKKKGGQGNNDDGDEARLLTSGAIVENNRVNQDGSMSPLGADDIFHMAQDHHLVKKFKFVEAIGVGNWGQVWKIRTRATQARPKSTLLAAKVIVRDKTDETIPARVRSIWQEFKIIRAFKADPHPNIIQMHDFIYSPGYALVTMDLHQDIIPTKVSEATARPWFAALLSAVAFMHARGVTHNDLKPANILLSRQNTPVIVDFGFANAWSTAAVKSDSSAFWTDLAWGTPEYLAPERAARKLHDERLSDIWSLGVTFYEVVIGRTPFEKDNIEEFVTPEALELYRKRTMLRTFFGPHRLSLALEDLIRQMVEPSVVHRMHSCSRGLQHTFFAQRTTSIRRPAGDSVRSYQIYTTPAQTNAGVGQSIASNADVSTKASNDLEAASSVLQIGSANKVARQLSPSGFRTRTANVDSPGARPSRIPLAPRRAPVVPMQAAQSSKVQPAAIETPASATAASKGRTLSYALRPLALRPQSVMQKEEFAGTISMAPQLPSGSSKAVTQLPPPLVSQYEMHGVQVKNSLYNARHSERDESAQHCYEPCRDTRKRTHTSTGNRPAFAQLRSSASVPKASASGIVAHVTPASSHTSSSTELSDSGKCSDWATSSQKTAKCISHAEQSITPRPSFQHDAVRYRKSLVSVLSISDRSASRQSERSTASNSSVDSLTEGDVTATYAREVIISTSAPQKRFTTSSLACNQPRQYVGPCWSPETMTSPGFPHEFSSSIHSALQVSKRVNVVNDEEDTEETLRHTAEPVNPGYTAAYSRSQYNLARPSTSSNTECYPYFNLGADRAQAKPVTKPVTLAAAHVRSMTPNTWEHLYKPCADVDREPLPPRPDTSALRRSIAMTRMKSFLGKFRTGSRKGDN